MDKIFEKLRVLADSAKYDVSCSSSGSERRNNGKIGSAAKAGICHTWSADGRCISLLKVLFTNKCIYDCVYCVNRRTADVSRESFEPEELAKLTIEFYKRNYIEGLFLSSAVEISPDHTAEKILRSLQILRYEHGFAGYIHAKVIPGVSQELIHQIGLVADRLSVNVEMPTEKSLKQFAPQKKTSEIFAPMKQITETLAERRALKGPGTMFKGKDLYENLGYLEGMSGKNSLSGGNGILADSGRIAYGVGATNAVSPYGRRVKEKFAPAGQTTQMIIGAGSDTDKQIVKTTEGLYHSFKMKRVYYSAYIPIWQEEGLPQMLTPPPLKREHRLYQADWLLRFYGFEADEILDDKNPFLDLDLDPKIAWALRNIERFPIEINKASLEELLRIPGVGSISAMRIVRQRRVGKIQYDDLKKIGVVLKRARFFFTCSGKYYGTKSMEPEYIRDQVLEQDLIRQSLLPIDDNMQISMFNDSNIQKGKINGLLI